MAARVPLLSTRDRDMKVTPMSPFEKHGAMKVEGIEGFTKNLQNP
ncbi:unnamed protein product, partial [Linum tenue]